MEETDRLDPGESFRFLIAGAAVLALMVLSIPGWASAVHGGPFFQAIYAYWGAVFVAL